MTYDLDQEITHHKLSIDGMAPGRRPPVLSLRDIEADPAARCCLNCGASLLLLLLRWNTWVSHRTEHVTFRDDRSVVRRVTAEFTSRTGHRSSPATTTRITAWSRC